MINVCGLLGMRSNPSCSLYGTCSRNNIMRWLR